MEQPVHLPGKRPRHVILGMLIIAVLGASAGVLLRLALKALGVTVSLLVTIPFGIVSVFVYFAITGRRSEISREWDL